MQIHRDRTGPAEVAPERGFIGEVTVAGYFRRPLPSRLSGASVEFAPGSRTPWKTSPCGQTLVVVSGSGWAQSAGQPTVELHPGDVVWFPPGELHWEGATPQQHLRYVALQEAAVQFEDAVTQEQYESGH